MASSVNRINSRDRRKSTDRAGTVVEYTERETVFKKRRLRRNRNKLSALLEEQNLPSCRAVQDACSNTDSRLEIAMDIMISLSDFYVKHNNLEKGTKVEVGEA